MIDTSYMRGGNMSSFLDKLRSRVTALTPKPDPTETAAVKHDRFDAANWDAVRSGVPAVRNLIDDLGNEHDYVDDLAKDFYNLIVKASPEMEDADSLKPTHRVHRPVVEGVKDSPEVEILSTYTVGDPFAAAMGLVSMSDGLREAADRLQHARERAEEAERKRADAKEWAQHAADKAAEAGDEPSEAEQQQLEQLVSQAERAAADADAAEQGADAAAEQAAAQAQQDLRNAARQAADDRQEEEDLTTAFGMGKGDLKRMDFNERLQLTRRLAQSRLAQFSEMIGQFRQLQMAEQRRRVKHVPDEISNVTLGDELHRMLPTEMLNLAADETEDDFWMRFVNGQLLVHELSGSEKLGKGPVIVVCDESGSMESPLGENATCEAWSKAFSLALCQQAKTQGRDFTYIGFSGPGAVHRVDMPGGEAPLDKVLTMTEHFFGGGTYYEAPLKQAMQIVVDAERRGLAKPDIVFITDEAYGQLDPDFVHEWNQVKERTSMRCFGIAMTEKVNGALQALGDNNRTVGSMTEGNPREVADIFRTI